MRECDRHGTESRPGGGTGLCAWCLRERLESLWRGEDQGLIRRDGRDAFIASEQAEPDGAATGASVVGSDIVAEWTEFHARRRRGVERDAAKAKSRSLDSYEVDALMATSRASSQDRSVVMSAHAKLRTRSMPMDNRSAEDTASRVIREQADELYADELDVDAFILEREQGGGVAVHEDRAPEAPRCLWPTTTKSTRPKWIRVLLSPLTHRNKVFPSRSKEDTRKGRGSRKRLTRFPSSDWSHSDDSHSHWLDALRGLPDRTTSLLSWLQDSERSKRKMWEREREGDAASYSSMTVSDDCESTDTLLKDLVTVGHLHEIAEEVEEEEGDEVLSPHSFDDMDSFGKFLLSAAHRHSSASLTRLSSAGSYT